MHPNLTLPNPFRPKQKRQGTRGSKWGTCRKAWSDLGPRWGETAKKWGQHEFWVNYNISLNWIKAIWGWFPLTMIPLRSQWGRYNLPRWIDLGQILEETMVFIGFLTIKYHQMIWGVLLFCSSLQLWGSFFWRMMLRVHIIWFLSHNRIVLGKLNAIPAIPQTDCIFCGWQYTITIHG